MRYIILINLVLLVGCQKSLQSKLQNNLIDVEFLDVDTHINNNQRDLSDIWNKIRSKIVSACEAFKNRANNTRKHIQDYVRKIKEKIKNITNNFETKFQNLKNNFRKIIENAVATGESVKSCINDDKEIIETLLKEIFLNVTICISNNINYMTKAEVWHNSLDFEDSLFLHSVENKMSGTLKKCEENNYQCLDKVQEEILNDIDVATWNVSNKAFVLKNSINDSLDTIVSCVTEGLTKASTSIVNETIQIIQCVKGKE